MRVVTKLTLNKIPALDEAMQRGVEKAVHLATFNVETIIKESMQGPKSGREYPRAGGKMHQASAPGEAPAIDYGLLVNSIQSEFVDETHGIVFTNTEYAEVLEYGGVLLAERPFMRPAATKAWPDFLDDMHNILSSLRP